MVTRLPPGLLYTEAVIWIESVGDAWNWLKPSCPVNSVPPLREDRVAVAVPKAVFEVASYALPVA